MKEYYLKLSEEIYNELGDHEKQYLNHLGMEVRQKPNKEDLEDENYKKLRNFRINAYNEEQKYLFNKNTNKL